MKKKKTDKELGEGILREGLFEFARENLNFFIMNKCDLNTPEDGTGKTFIQWAKLEFDWDLVRKLKELGVKDD